MKPRRFGCARILVVPPVIQVLWACMLIFAIYTNVIGWFVAQGLGDERWIQWPLILLGFNVGFIADDLRCHWIYGVAHALHFEDVIDGVCPDHAGSVSESAVWDWYEKHGRPLWHNPRRKRPKVRFADAWDRMSLYHEAMLSEERRLTRRRKEKNHRV